jgi:hypothetical protein
MWFMAAMKQQKSNDEFRGLFCIEPCYILCVQSVSVNRDLYVEFKFFSAVENYRLVA